MHGGKAEAKESPPPKVGDSGEKTSAVSPDAAELTKQGWQLWQSGLMKMAIPVFEKAIKLDPKYEEAWNGLGWAVFNTGKLPEAEKDFLQAIALNPDHSGALNGLGQVYFFQEKFDQAEKFLLQAAPKESAAWWGLTRLYLLQEKYEEAEKWAIKIVNLDGGNPIGHQLLNAAREKHVSKAVRAIIEPKDCNSIKPEGK